jgi:hypothetical protein
VQGARALIDDALDRRFFKDRFEMASDAEQRYLSAMRTRIFGEWIAAAVPPSKVQEAPVALDKYATEIANGTLVKAATRRQKLRVVQLGIRTRSAGGLTLCFDRFEYRPQAALSFEVERIDDRFGVVECPLRPGVGGDTLSVLADLQD